MPLPGVDVKAMSALRVATGVEQEWRLGLGFGYASGSRIKGQGWDQTCSRTREPMAPLPGVGMKAMSAVRAVRTLQLGCQCSGWWLLMLRHTCERPPAAGHRPSAGDV